MSTKLDEVRREVIASERRKFKDREIEAELRLRGLCRSYESIRLMPGIEREAIRMALEHALQTRGGVFRDGDHLYQWSKTERSLVRMKAVQHPHGTWTHRTE